MQTFIRAFVSCICVLTAAMSARAGDSPLEKTFARGVYWPWEATATNAKIAGKNIWEFTDDTMAMLKNEWHVNVIWFVHGAGDAARLCDLAAKHGILVLVATPLEHHIAHGMPSEPELAKTAQAAVAPMRDKTALGAYVLKDEPLAVEVAQQETYRRLLARGDPSRPSIVVTMPKDTETYIAKSGFPIVCSDVYHFGGPQSPNIPNPASVSQNSYRNTVGAIVHLAAFRDKITWIMPQAFSDAWGPWWLDERSFLVIEPDSYWHWRMPTIAEIHWQTWEAVRAGCRGVVFYSILEFADNDWRPDKGPMPESMKKRMEIAKAERWPVVKERISTGEPPGLTLPGGRPTPQGRAMGNDFAFLEQMEQTLVALRSTPFHVAFADAPAALNTFESAADPSCRYVVAVNDDVVNPRNISIHFLPHVAAIADLRAKADLTLTDAPMGETVFRTTSLMLGPGEGTILKVAFREGQPGLLLYHEDFSLNALTVALKNANRRMDRRVFDLGYQSCICQTDPQGKPGIIEVKNLKHAPHSSTPLAGALELSAQGIEDVFLRVEGVFPQSNSLAVSFIKKNGVSEWTPSEALHLPCRVPPDTTSIKMVMRSGAVVRSFSLWRVPRPSR